MKADDAIRVIHQMSRDLEDEDHQTNPTKAAVAFSVMREAYESLREQHQKAKQAYDAARQSVIPQIFQAGGVTSLTVAGYRFTVSTGVRCSMRAGKKDACLEWLRENDLGDVIQPTVNAGTLASVARTEIEKGEELPEDLFNTYYQDNTSMTKVK